MAKCDALERCDRIRTELERLRDVVCEDDVASIDAALDESQNAPRERRREDEHGHT